MNKQFVVTYNGPIQHLRGVVIGNGTARRCGEQLFAIGCTYEAIVAACEKAAALNKPVKFKGMVITPRAYTPRRS